MKLLPWIDSARKKYPQYPDYNISLRWMPPNKHQIVLHVYWRHPLPVGTQRDSSGVVVLAEGKSWQELGLTKK